MTSQLIGILLVVVSTVMACLVSLTLEKRQARRGVPGKPQQGERRRHPPLHY